jgi:hypothetical protein
MIFRSETVFALVCVSLSLGCVSTGGRSVGDPETPVIDAKFGDAVRSARLAQTIDPQAASKTSTTHALDARSGKAAHEAYVESNKTRAVIPVVVSGTGQ